MNLSFFQKLVKVGLVEVLPIEAAFYELFPFPEKKRIKREIVEINFAQYSPYGEASRLLFKTFDDKIGVWFTQKTFTTPIVIPESYLLYLALKAKGDGLYLFETEPQKIVILGNGLLQRQVAKKRFQSYEKVLLQKEFNLDRVVTYSEKEYRYLFDHGIKQLSLTDLYTFHRIRIDRERLLRTAIEKSALPVGLTLLALLGIQGLFHLYIDRQTHKVTDEYRKIKNANSVIAERFDTVDDYARRLAPVQKKITETERYFHLLDRLSKTAQEHNATFEMVHFMGRLFRIRVESNATDALFTDLVKAKDLERLTIRSTIKLRSGRERATIQGEIVTEGEK